MSTIMVQTVLMNVTVELGHQHVTQSEGVCVKKDGLVPVATKIWMNVQQIRVTKITQTV